MALSQRKTGVLLSYMGEAVKIATGLLYTPIMLRLLGQSEYGLYQLVYSIVSYLSLLSLGFGSAYIRYHSKYEAENDREGIARLNGMFMLIFASLSAICVLCGGFLVFNAGAVFGDGLTAQELEKAKVLLAIMVINMALTFPNTVFNCYVSAHERFIFQKLLRLAQNVLNPFLALPLMLMGFGSVAVVSVTTVLTLAVLISNLFYCKKALKIEFCYSNLKFSLLKEMWVFTFFIFLGQIIDQINWSTDKFLLGRMSGTIAVAIYGVASQINNMYVQTSTAIASVFTPEVNRVVAKGNSEKELTRILTKVGRIQFAILALIVTGFVFFGKPFIKLWVGEGYDAAYYIVLLLIIPVTVPLIQNVGVEIQRAKNMHKARAVVYFFVAVGNILLSIPLIKLWGGVGAAAGTAAALILGNIIFMNWYYHKKIGLDMFYFWKNFVGFIPSLLCSGIFAVVFLKFVNVTGWISLIISAGIYTAVYFASMWIFSFNSYEKSIVKGAFSKILKKVKK